MIQKRSTALERSVKIFYGGGGGGGALTGLTVKNIFKLKDKNIELLVILFYP